MFKDDMKWISSFHNVTYLSAPHEMLADFDSFRMVESINYMMASCELAHCMHYIRGNTLNTNEMCAIFMSNTTHFLIE